MVQEGLFDRFPCDEVYGMHNWPLLPAGRIAVRPGPIMAAADQFDVEIHGKGAHGAMPHLGVDPVFIAAQVRSEEHTSELQSLMRISYAVFCLKKKIIHIQPYISYRQ